MKILLALVLFTSPLLAEDLSSLVEEPKSPPEATKIEVPAAPTQAQEAPTGIAATQSTQEAKKTSYRNVALFLGGVALVTLGIILASRNEGTKVHSK